MTVRGINLSTNSGHGKRGVQMFRDISYYKPDIKACARRVNGFFSMASGAPQALIYTFPSVLTLRGPILNQYNFEHDMESYLDDYLEYQAQLTEIRRGIEDDWIPSVVPYMGIGEFSAFVAGEIEFGEDTSWAAPVVTEKSELDELRLDPNNKWFTRLNTATRYLVRKISPYRIPYGRGYYSPLDLAWALRGESIYMDFYEDPQFVHDLMELALRATEWFARAQASEIFAPDVVHEYSAWHCGPNRIAISEDISSLISPNHYSQYAAPYTQRLFDSFGIGEVHCHSAGPHVVPEFLKLTNVRQIQIVADPNTRRPVEILADLVDSNPELFGRSSDIAVIQVDASPEEAVQYYDLSRRTRVVFSVVTETAEEAQHAVQIFRERQKQRRNLLL